MAKRAFVSVILALAHAYKLVANINRDSDDASILKMYRRVLLKVHPDKGGKKTDGSRWVSTWTTTCTDYSHFALHVTQGRTTMSRVGKESDRSRRRRRLCTLVCENLGTGKAARPR